MTATLYQMRAFDNWLAAQAAKKAQEQRLAAVTVYVKSNTPEGASGCCQAVVSQEGRAVAARGSRPQSFAGMNSARAAVSTTPAAPENPGTVSLTPHAAVGAGLGLKKPVKPEQARI